MPFSNHLPLGKNSPLVKVCIHVSTESLLQGETKEGPPGIQFQRGAPEANVAPPVSSVLSLGENRYKMSPQDIREYHPTGHHTHPGHPFTAPRAAEGSPSWCGQASKVDPFSMEYCIVVAGRDLPG